MQWNFADLWEIVASRLPQATALMHGDRRVSWSEFGRRADAVARFLLDAGVERQDKIAQFLFNGPEYLESVFAAFKAGLVPVNGNFLDEEIAYLLDHSDSVAVVFHGRLADALERVRADVPRVKIWLWVDDRSGPCPAWATRYEDAAAAEPDAPNVHAPWGRTPDDLCLLYTGGTTGFPKAAMWRQEDLFLIANQTQRLRFPVDASPDEAAALLKSPGPRHIPVCPLIHGFGSLTSFQALSSGGSVVTLTGSRFDPIELLDTIARERVDTIAISGPTATHILDALDAAPGAWDLSSLKTLMSSGAMFSAATKRGLVQHSRRLMILDALGTSETSGLAWSVTGARTAVETAAFRISEETGVITDDGRLVQPGSGELGLLAKRGNTAIGYYKDEARTEAAYRVVDGVRWLTPGDIATVEADGSIRLLGRASNCLSNGGERIFVEEVEEALKLHPAVRDAAVVGTREQHDDVVSAIVEPEPGSKADADEIIAFAKTTLAPFKAPQKLLIVPSLDRLMTGKNDYRRWQEYAATTLA